MRSIGSAMRTRPDACATVGFVQVSPNSRNTIPGRVFFTVDFRHPEDAVLSLMDRELRAACAAAAARQTLDAAVEEFWYSRRPRSTRHWSAAVREAAAAQGYPHQDIVSGAGHDAVYMARIAPSRDDLRSLRGRHQPQRDRGRQTRRSDRRLQCPVQCGSRHRRVGVPDAASLMAVADGFAESYGDAVKKQPVEFSYFIYRQHGVPYRIRTSVRPDARVRA